VRDRVKAGAPVALVVAIVAALLLIVLIVRRTRGRHDIPRDDPALIEMLRQFLKNRSGADPLHLARRQFFRTAAGRTLSIERLDRAAWGGPLLACAPSSAALPHVVSEDVLDSTDGLLRAVRDLLPDTIDLDELTTLANAPTDPALRAVARAAARLDAACTISERDGDQLLEARVRTRDPGRLSPRHIVVGRALLPAPDDDDVARAVAVARRLLAGTTLFRAQSQRLLALVAHEAMRPGAP
jgi:hypothetical protein